MASPRQEPEGMIDVRARELANSALASLAALREVLVERERNDERRWKEASEMYQGSVRRIENTVSNLQQSYRDGMDSLSHQFMQRQDTHELNDRAEFKLLNDRFQGVFDWKDKVQYGLIGFLCLCVLSLIGVIYSVGGIHHP
jgi:hypothetical protein